MVIVFRRKNKKKKISRAERLRVLKKRTLTGLLVGVVSMNGLVSWIGESSPFPLSPFHAGDKLMALGYYAIHRPFCLVRKHPPPTALIREAESAHGLPAGLLRALIRAESGMKPHRISAAGAMGYGQLMPSTARMLGLTDPYNSKAAIMGSAKYLKQQLRHFRDLRLALAAYNAGPGAVLDRIPKNGQTEKYVRRVLAIYRGQE